MNRKGQEVIWEDTEDRRRGQNRTARVSTEQGRTG